MKRIVGIIMLVLAAGTCPNLALAADAEFRLAGVKFEGVRAVTKSDLARTLAARMPPAWKFWLKAPVVTLQDLESDLLRIRQFYRENGYYQSQAQYTVEREADAHETAAAVEHPWLKVTYTVTEGPPVIVDRIEIGLKAALPEIDPADMHKDIALRKGRIFRRADYEESKRQIVRFMGNRGYPFAGIEGRAMVDIQGRRAEIEWSVTSGPLCSFGPIEIQQAGDAVSEATILRALPFKPGERYAVDAVTAARRNLYKLDVFKTVIVEPKAPPAGDRGAVVMRLDLVSKSRNSLKFGIGYGSEDGLRLQGAWTRRNLFKRAGRFTVSARRSDLIQNFQLSFEQPYTPDADSSVNASAGLEREDFTAYTNRILYTNAALLRNFGKDLYWKAGYTLEENRWEELKVSDPRQAALFSEEKTYRVSSLELQFARDTRDDLLDPSEGSFAVVLAELASDLLGSELAYVRPAGELRKYFALGDAVVISGRVRLETVQEFGDTDVLPIFKKLFLGGANTVRGYAFQELPPLDFNGKPLGGQTALNANFELRYPIYKALRGVVFVDMGQVDPEPFSLNLSEMRYSTGLGLRYNTPVGPIRLDVGYKLNPPTGKDIGDLNRPDEVIGDRWRVYISIGQAF